MNKQYSMHGGTVQHGPSGHAPSPERWFSAEPGDQLATVKLTSIEHVANGNNPIDSNFDLALTIADGGINPMESLQLNNEAISPGQKKPYNEQLFMGTYDAAATVVLQFFFTVGTPGEIGVFSDHTDGDNALNAGVQHFTCPVKFETGQSTLLFRGRVDLV